MATINHIRKSRNLPFIKRGMKVYSHYYNRHGVICGANDSGNINIRFSGDKYSQNYHPCWQISYYDRRGNIIESFRDNT
jgi:hypothetical protein